VTGKFEWSRRDFLIAAGLASALRPLRAAADESVVFPVEFRKPGPYESLRRFIQPGSDGFACEREAAEIENVLSKLLATRAIPLAADFEGASPVAARMKALDGGEIAIAEFDAAAGDFTSGLQRWLTGLKTLRCIALPDHRVRFEASGSHEGKLEYRTGHWHMEWTEGRLSRFHPLDETRATRLAPRFVDCSNELLGRSSAWRNQLLRGTPYWRARLDSASGIDIYGSNGISVGDIDNDGWDEIYVCQPGGLPNRLFKRNPDGTWDDIAAQAGIDLLDDSTCALFVDFRNSGSQDLVVLRGSSPLYFKNDGHGRFELVPDVFHFATPVQGTFTGMSAVDYDNDGLVDLYFCTYVYFQSEDRYRYPVPYHDAQNGPPNFLMRNRGGYFEDVTQSSGINQNNNRYSFSAVWCDYDNSGSQSLYVANDFGRNNLYRNRGGKFEDVAKQAGVEDLGPGMCASWFDYDGDGRADLYVANMWTPAGQRVVADPGFPNASTPELKDAYRRHTKGNSLYRNRGDGTFEERPEADGAAVGRWAWGHEGIDFDNDGVPEILGACGMLTNSKPEDLMSFFWRQVVAKSPVTLAVAPEYEAGWNSINQYIREEYSWNGAERNLFYVNKDGRFRDCSGVSGLDWPNDSRTFAVTDLDGDGNLDLFLKSRLGPQVRAIRNVAGRDRTSIAFQLRGTKSNRDAIGASIENETSNGNRQRKFVQAGSGYLSQHTKRIYFGLDHDSQAARVHINWPSGLRQSFEKLAAGHVHEITEGTQEIHQTPFLKSPDPHAAEAHGDNSVALTATWLLEPVPLPERLEGPGFVLLTDGRHHAPAGVKVQTINLKTAPPDTAAAYALFRRYLFDWRAPLTTPLMILIDSDSRAHKIYPDIPTAAELRADLAALNAPDRLKLALPFAGRYIDKPARNYYKLGAAFASAGYDDQALPYLDAAVAQSPGNFKAWLAIGQVHLESNRIPEARKGLEKALALNANSPEVWNNLGGVAIAEGHNDEALRCFEKMLSLAPDSVYGLTNAALALTRIGRKEDAEKLYRKALDLQPNDSETADRLGLLIGQQGRLPEAIALFKRALTSDPHNASAINNLGVAYVESGQVPDAIAAFEYGIKTAPTNAMMFMNLARLYVAQNQREKAREVLRALLERDPNHAAARRALEQLKEP
jgi:tetratricopeptide (TPR) repeat protein